MVVLLQAASSFLVLGIVALLYIPYVIMYGDRRKSSCVAQGRDKRSSANRAEDGSVLDETIQELLHPTFHRKIRLCHANESRSLD
jgi:hypothetical protein